MLDRVKRFVDCRPLRPHRLIAFFALLILAIPQAHAWWNADWKFRKKVSFNTSAEFADVKEAVGPVPVAVRLHTGNFLFTDAKPDGSDIRFVAGDDKTPLKHHIELFDATNQLAIVWVQVPRIAPSANTDFIYLYSGNEKIAAGDDAKGVYDAQTLLALRFGEPQPPFKDSTAYANPVSGDAVKVDTAGLAGGAALFDGAGPLKVGTVATARVTAGTGVSFAAWVKPAAAQNAQLFSWGPLVVQMAGAQVTAKVDDKAVAGGGALAPGQWSHVAVAVSDRIAIFVNGKEVATQAAKLPELAGAMTIGDGFTGAIDSLEVSSVARTAGWFQIAAAQGQDGKLVGYGDPEAGDSGGGDLGYFKILLNSLTIDAKVVIAILAVMFAIAVWVMISKAIQLAKTDRQNNVFIEAFEGKPAEYLDPSSRATEAMANGMLPSSSMARMYATGMRELKIRVDQMKSRGVKRDLSAESVAAIRATIDSTFIRELQKLNKLMVLLTIAISGGPFLGLLGTVVGVMITFAAIAAQGDVNINAIAPGIAAALLATVAGLAVAIPSLFGYNYLITRIKSITADMQAFADEFIAKLAESHNQ